MKKFKSISVVMTAALLMTSLLTACNTNTETTTTSDTSETIGSSEATPGSEETSESESSEGATTTTTPPSSEPSYDSSSAPTGDPDATDASSEVVIGKTKVMDAFKKSFKTMYYGKVTSSYPKIIIDGVDTSAINNEISKKLKKVSKKNKSEYYYYIGEDYVSILIEVTHDVDWMEYDHYIYNISRVTGKKMSREEMLGSLGVKSSDFNSRVKKQIVKQWETINKYDKTAATKKLYKKAISKKTLNSAIPYANEKGKLCYFIKGMEMPAGAAYVDSYGPC